MVLLSMGNRSKNSVPVELHDGDHVGIGEHELIFQLSSPVADHVEDMPTIAVPYESQTYRTQDDDQHTLASNDDYGTSAMEVEQGAGTQPEVETPACLSLSLWLWLQMVPRQLCLLHQRLFLHRFLMLPWLLRQVQLLSRPSLLLRIRLSPTNTSYIAESTPVISTPSTGNDIDVSFNRLSNLSQPALPDMTDLTAALSTLDGQVMSLQQQLNATQEALQAHDAEVAQTANQLRTGVRKVSERMDNTIADVARTREALAWADLLQLMEDVMNNPRDIEYVTKLARKARELNKVFQLHQSVLNTMAECNSLLRSMVTKTIDRYLQAIPCINNSLLMKGASQLMLPLLMHLIHRSRAMFLMLSLLVLVWVVCSVPLNYCNAGSG